MGSSRALRGTPTVCEGREERRCVARVKRRDLSPTVRSTTLLFIAPDRVRRFFAAVQTHCFAGIRVKRRVSLRLLNTAVQVNSLTMTYSLRDPRRAGGV